MPQVRLSRFGGDPPGAPSFWAVRTAGVSADTSATTGLVEQPRLPRQAQPLVANVVEHHLVPDPRRQRRALAAGPEPRDPLLVGRQALPDPHQLARLGAELSRSERERGRRAQLAAVAHHPGVPCPSERLNRARQRAGRGLPVAATAGTLAVPLARRAVALCPCDHPLGDRAAKRETRLGVAREAHPGCDAPPRNVLRGLLDRGLGGFREQVLEHARPGPRDRRVLRRVAGICRRRNERADRGALSAVTVLPVGGRDRGVVHRNAHVGIGA